MSKLLERVGAFCVRHARIVIGIWVVIAIGVALFARAAGDNTSDNLTLPGTDSTNATDLLQAKLPEQANGSNPVVLEPRSGRLNDPANAKVVAETVKSLSKTSHVESAVSPLSPQGAANLSKDGRIGYVAVTLDVGPGDLDEDEANDVIDAADPARDAGFKVATGGYLGKEVSKPSTHDSEVIGLAAAVVILLFAFGTVVAMGLPITTALVGLVTGLGLVTLGGHLTEIPSVAPTLATMIGLGVGIDYALFIVTQHRSYLKDGLEPDVAAAKATGSAGGAVAFAGGTVVIALCSLALAGIPLVSALGFSAAVVVLIAALTAVTLIPALLGLLGRRIESLRVPFGGRDHSDSKAHGWKRWAEGVARRPWPALVTAVVILVVLAFPVRELELGQADNGQLPTSTTLRQSYDLITEGFGEGANGPFLIAVKSTDVFKPATPQPSAASSQPAGADPRTTDPRLTKLQQTIRKKDGVQSVSPAVLDKKGNAAVFTVIATTAPSDEATEDLVRDLRSTTIPKAVKGTDLDVSVGGQTAGYIDLADKISDKLVSVIAIVVALSFLLLMLAFRSIVVPLTAALMNLLSVAAAYGVVTAVFQKGWGEGLVGLEGTVPVVSFVPLLMFAILFGLSMDYQVFLVTRIHEHYREGHDNLRAVIGGLASSGRVITSAALIMVSVFTSFILNGDPVVKQFGVGLAVAIAVDATIVRCLLVPAVMVLCGERNWWFPGWLERRLPRIGIE